MTHSWTRSSTGVMATNDHLVDTEIRLGNCNRCQGWVYLAMSSGLRSAADIVPVNRQQYIQALVDGRRLFRLHTRAGKPWKLGTTRPRDLNPAFDAAGNQQGELQLLAEHGCGGAARNMLTFREVEAGPPPAPAMPGERRGGALPPAAHASGLTVEEVPRRSPAAPASRPRSSPALTCHECRKSIMPGEEFWGFQIGDRWEYAAHA